MEEFKTKETAENTISTIENMDAENLSLLDKQKLIADEIDVTGDKLKELEQNPEENREKIASNEEYLEDLRIKINLINNAISSLHESGFGDGNMRFEEASKIEHRQEVGRFEE